MSAAIEQLSDVALAIIKTTLWSLFACAFLKVIMDISLTSQILFLSKLANTVWEHFFDNSKSDQNTDGSCDEFSSQRKAGILAVFINYFTSASKKVDGKNDAVGAQTEKLKSKNTIWNYITSGNVDAVSS